MTPAESARSRTASSGYAVIRMVGMGFSEAEQEIDDLVAFMASLTSPQYKE